MGQLCSSSKESSGDSAAATTNPTGGGTSHSAVRGAAATKFSYQLAGARREKQELPNAPSRDPADYESTGLADATWVRLPGQINDQRINIEGAKRSTFLLLDHCDSVQIDECEDCTFFIGPTTGSVFIRGCKNCKAVVLCGQLRMRDCVATDLALHSRSRPVIESSRKIGIGCFAGPHYLDLRWQLARAGMSTFTNLYSSVHDFTPAEGNWHLLTPAETARLIPGGLEPLLPAGSSISGDGDFGAAVVPVFHGGAHDDKLGRNGAVLLCKAGFHGDAESLLWDVVGADATAPLLLEAGEVKLTEEMVAALGVAHVKLRGGVLRAGDVHPFIVLRGDSSIVAARFDEWAARPEVLLGAQSGAVATAMREHLLSSSGKDDGFGQAF